MYIQMLMEVIERVQAMVKLKGGGGDKDSWWQGERMVGWWQEGE